MDMEENNNWVQEKIDGIKSKIDDLRQKAESSTEDMKAKYHEEIGRLEEERQSLMGKMGDKAEHAKDETEDFFDNL